MVAGDEKLLKFRGKCNDVRDVKSKPDRIGLWYYELMLTLDNELPFLVHIKLWSVDTGTRQSQPVFRVVEDWCRVLTRIGSPSTILIFDSYYTTEASIQVMKKG